MGLTGSRDTIGVNHDDISLPLINNQLCHRAHIPHHGTAWARDSLHRITPNILKHLPLGRSPCLCARIHGDRYDIGNVPGSPRLLQRHPVMLDQHHHQHLERPPPRGLGTQKLRLQLPHKAAGSVRRIKELPHRKIEEDQGREAEALPCQELRGARAPEGLPVQKELFGGTEDQRSQRGVQVFGFLAGGGSDQEHQVFEGVDEIDAVFAESVNVYPVIDGKVVWIPTVGAWGDVDS